MDPGANEDTILAWNTVLFDRFQRFRQLVADGAGAHGAAALERHPLRPGARVLDLGCAFGDSTRPLADLVGPGGEVVGVDCAERFIQVAEHERTLSGRRNMAFFVADVQADDLRGPYDRVFSRFGTMFFASPVAALRNLRRQLAPGGLLTMVCWRRREDNAFIHAAEVAVRAVVPEADRGSGLTCGPGPFSMADADVVSSQLTAAGFTRSTFERFDTDIRIGNDLSDAVEFAMALGPAGEVLRLAGASAAERLRPKVVEALREALSPFVRTDGVFGRSSSWIISARGA
jgi:SAM-dependent methyltransferase